MKRAHFAALPLTLLTLLLLLVRTSGIHDRSQNERGNPNHAAKHNPKDDLEQLDQLVDQRCKSCEEKDQTLNQLKAQVSNLKQINKNLETQLQKNKQSNLDQTNIQIAYLRQENKLLQVKLQQQFDSLLKIQDQLRTTRIRLDEQSAKFEEQQGRLTNIQNQLSTTQIELQKQTTRSQDKSVKLIHIQNQLYTTKIRLQQQIAKKDCIECPQIHCPTITCPEHEQCNCQICKKHQPCQKPSPCPQLVPPVCPPQIVCPQPKPCNCEICQQPVVCPEVTPCPQIQCPEAQPCPIYNCESQLSQIASLQSKNQALQSAYNKVSKQRDACLKDDSDKIRKQELIQIKSQISVQLTQILSLIESTLFSSYQKLNFSTIKSLLDQIRSYLNSEGQVSWSQSLVYYRQIFTKLIEQLEGVSSLTADTIQLNNKYSSGLKSLRDRLASCESILR